VNESLIVDVFSRLTIVDGCCSFANRGPNVATVPVMTMQHIAKETVRSLIGIFFFAYVRVVGLFRFSLRVSFAVALQ
jgi:hypothetical protein